MYLFIYLFFLFCKFAVYTRVYISAYLFALSANSLPSSSKTSPLLLPRFRMEPKRARSELDLAKDEGSRKRSFGGESSKELQSPTSTTTPSKQARKFMIYSIFDVEAFRSVDEEALHGPLYGLCIDLCMIHATLYYQ